MDGAVDRPSRASPPSAAEKLRILIQAERLTASALDDYLRREGLSRATLDDWRATAAATANVRAALTAKSRSLDVAHLSRGKIVLASAVVVVIALAVTGSIVGDRVGGPKDLGKSNFNPNDEDLR